jgi:hypothetical protein
MIECLINSKCEVATGPERAMSKSLAPYCGADNSRRGWQGNEVITHDLADIPCGFVPGVRSLNASPDRDHD